MRTTTNLIKGDYECADGPWAGERVFLTRNSHAGVLASTAFFEYRGHRGRYKEDPLDGKLYWEKYDDTRKQPF